MNPDPSDPNQLPPLLDPNLESKRSLLSKEWAFIYVFVVVMIVIVALVAYHLVHG